jgi:hypothetical protein
LLKDGEKIPFFKHTFMDPPVAFCPNSCKGHTPPQKMTAGLELQTTKGTERILTIVHLNSFSFVGRISLQAHQRKIWTTCGTCSFQMAFQADFEFGLVEQLLWSLALRSTSR